MKRPIETYIGIAVLLLWGLLLVCGWSVHAQVAQTGAGRGTPTVTPVLTGKVLLVDGASFLLLVDNTSKLCRAGGC